MNKSKLVTKEHSKAECCSHFLKSGEVLKTDIKNRKSNIKIHTNGHKDV